MWIYFLTPERNLATMIKRAFCLFTLFFLIACNETAIESDIKPIPVPLDAPISSGKLGGLFTDGGGHTPVILIIPGSGPTDKDGNSGRRFQSNSYKFLAYQLAQNGISTVRVDKRGMFSSETAGDGNAVSIEIYAKDYRNWVKTILAKTGQPCVYLMGHSEGGLMAIATARGENNICGLILLATPGQKLGDVLRNQLRANPANTPILQKAEESIGKLEAGETVDTTEMHPALQGLF